MATTDDKKITQRDSDVSAFLRSLGGTMQAIGATAAEAMGRLDFRSLGYSPRTSNYSIPDSVPVSVPSLCWDRFVGESGSELVNRSVRMFLGRSDIGWRTTESGQ